MRLFSPLRRARGPARPAPSQARLGLENLEDRRLLSTATISGYVYYDANNNGLFDPGELPLASSNLELHNAAGATVATAVSAADGSYQFTTDGTVNTAPQTRTVVATFDNAPSNWTKTVQVAQFDPSLGTLTGIDVINTTTLTTDMQEENLDAAAATITASVQGGVTVSGPGVQGLTASVQAADSFNAAPFDGTIDFSGPSGHDSGAKKPSASQSVTLTDPADLALFTGTGTVSFDGRATATSTTGGPGNVLTLINTTAGAELKVVYHYVPSNALQPGNYTIVQTTVPAGYVGGQLSSGGVVLPNSAGSHTIPVTLGTTSLTDNDFGELQPPVTPQVTPPLVVTPPQDVAPPPAASPPPMDMPPPFAAPPLTSKIELLASTFREWW
jgi:hypothetical protein